MFKNQMPAKREGIRTSEGSPAMATLKGLTFSSGITRIPLVRSLARSRGQKPHLACPLPRAKTKDKTPNSGHHRLHQHPSGVMMPPEGQAPWDKLLTPNPGTPHLPPRTSPCGVPITKRQAVVFLLPCRTCLPEHLNHFTGSCKTSQVFLLNNKERMITTRLTGFFAPREGKPKFIRRCYTL